MTLPLDIGMFHATLPAPGRKSGGVEVFVQRMADQLVAHGHACTVYSLDRESPPGAGFRHVSLFPRLATLLEGKLARWFLLPFLLNFAPFRRHDVLVLHGDDWFYVRRRMPTFRLFHGAALFEARSATSTKRRIMQRLIHLGEKLSARLADRTGSVGPESARLFGCAHVVDLGIDPSLHHPGEKTLHPSFLFVGTWEGRKQGHAAWSVFRDRILPAFPDATLDFVADIPPPEECHGVRYVRFPSDFELAALYGRSWIFLYPSSYEGFGIPYLEALASGCAVVCLANEGSLRLLTGCPAADIVASPADLARACLERIRQTPDGFRQEAVAWARPFFWPAVIGRWEEILRAVATEGRGRPARGRG